MQEVVDKLVWVVIVSGFVESFTSWFVIIVFNEEFKRVGVCVNPSSCLRYVCNFLLFEIDLGVEKYCGFWSLVCSFLGPPIDLWNLGGIIFVEPGTLVTDYSSSVQPMFIPVGFYKIGWVPFVSVWVMWSNVGG